MSNFAKSENEVLSNKKELHQITNWIDQSCFDDVGICANSVKSLEGFIYTYAIIHIDQSYYNNSKNKISFLQLFIKIWSQIWYDYWTFTFKAIIHLNVWLSIALNVQYSVLILFCTNVSSK